MENWEESYEFGRDRITWYDKRAFTRFPFRPQRKQDRIVWTMIRYGAREKGGRSFLEPADL